jgi:hypothetical protein
MSKSTSPDMHTICLMKCLYSEMILSLPFICL